ncbi:Molybdopterin converting factor, small subunit [Nakamurella panacisegetis]|uniref:Molybdopterin converting factor, small subunit n=1 Tax=Nakamurella panacisegetis TaxID=1090615 RepID=A0A1H0J6R6_9ACTN|nr:MoaD/ThiS family protein [Nakamurella panacisegetis]SDO39425.1 Molybdopterin converting factor, small subunit [Nakamurella panacisegetis]
MAEPGPVSGPRVVVVTLRYYAAARAAAGVDSEKVELPAPATVADALAVGVHRHGDVLERVLRRCSYLLGEVAVHTAATAVTDGDAIDVLPPFAGG